MAYSKLIFNSIFKVENLLYFFFLSFCLNNTFVNLALIIGLIIFFIKFSEIKIFLINFKYIFLLLVLFWIVLVISTIINSYSDTTLVLKSIFYLRFLLFPFVVIYMLSKINKIYFIYFINLIIFLLIFDIFFQFFFSYDLFGYHLKDLGNPRMDRVSGFFGPELIAGTYLSLFGFLSLFLISETKIFNNKYFFYLIYIIVLISAIIITGDRVGIIFIAGIFLFNLIFNKKLRKLFIILFLFGSLLLSIIIFSSEKLSYRYVGNINDITKTNFFKNPSIKGILKSPWASHYLVSLEMSADKVFIGHGLKGFRKYCDKYKSKEKLSTYKRKCTTHPHNTYLEILVESGIIGLLIFIILNLIIFYNVFKNKLTIVVLCYSVLFAILNPLRPSGSFFSTWSGAVYWFILSVVMYYLFSKKNNNLNYILK